MNSKRYFSNLLDLLEIEELKVFFEVKPFFEIHSGKNQFTLAKKFSLQKVTRKGYKYLY